MKKETLLVLSVLFMGALKAQENTILIIADDVSPDYFGVFSPNTDTANAPNIRLLAENGVKFSKVWASPVCSPTRGGILTGKYPFRTGIGEIITNQSSPQISLSEIGIGNLVRDLGPVEYNTACIGKWHLNNNAANKHSYPNSLGFNFYAGNFNGAISDYYNYQRVSNGVVDTVTTYATTQTIDDAIGWLDTINGANPFFLWIAFNAPHDPYHLPPASICNTVGLPGTTGHIAANKEKYFKAAIEAMDTEMGRLFTYLETNNLLSTTNIIFVGDNGNGNQVAQIPSSPNHAKGTVYNYGVDVPMIIKGPAVVDPNRTSDALVNTPDIYATIAELCGYTNWQSAIPTGDVVDSRSFLPIIKNQTTQERTWIFTEAFKTNPSAMDGKTIRNENYQLIRFDAGQEEFYNVSLDAPEVNNLLLNISTMTNLDWDNYVFLCDSLGALTGTTGCPFLETSETEKVLYSISPNPFQEQIVIKGDISSAEFHLLNTIGQDNTDKVKVKVTNSTIVLQTAKLNSGTYFIRIGDSIRKVVKL